MHGDPNDVLGQRDFGLVGIGGDEAAGHRHVGGDLSFDGEIAEGGESPGAGDDRETVGVSGDGADDEVGQQSVCGDRGFQFRERLQSGVGLADVRGGDFEPVERDRLDSRVGLHIGGVHAMLLEVRVGADRDREIRIGWIEIG